MNRDHKAQLFGLAAVLLWSTVATAFKLSLRSLQPAQLLFWATVFSLLALGSILVAQQRFHLLLKAEKKQYLRAAGLGLLNPFLYYAVLFAAYDRLPAQIAQPLNYTWALTLSWLSVPLLRHRLHRHDILSSIVCYAGVVIISTAGHSGGLGYDPWGIALALGSTLIWALYWIYNTRSDLDPVVGLFLGFLFSLPVVTLYAALSTGIATGGRAGLLGGAYVGAFEMGFTYVLWLWAMKLTTNTSRVANLIFLSPFLSLVFIGVVLGESIHLATVAGLVLIVAGLLTQQRGNSTE